MHLLLGIWEVFAYTVFSGLRVEGREGNKTTRREEEEWGQNIEHSPVNNWKGCDQLFSSTFILHFQEGRDNGKKPHLEVGKRFSVSGILINYCDATAILPKVNGFFALGLLANKIYETLHNSCIHTLSSSPTHPPISYRAVQPCHL